MIARFAALRGVLASASVLALLALVHSQLAPAAARLLPLPLLAVVGGMLLATRLPLRPLLAPGLALVAGAGLKFAIVLLGARMELGQVAAVGGRALLVVLGLMALSLAVARGLGHLAKIPPRLATLIGVGTAVCGNSAIAAAAPTIGAREEEVGYAIAQNTLFGTLALLLYPGVGSALGMDPLHYGSWAGLGVNDTAQVVAAGFALGEVAGQRATLVKLARNAMMGVALVAAGALHGSRASGGELLRRSLPPFVLGFLLLAALRSAGALEAAGSALGLDLVDLLAVASHWLLLWALVAVGLSTRLDRLRALGPRPLLVGLGTASAVSGVAFLLIRNFPGLLAAR